MGKEKGMESMVEKGWQLENGGIVRG
jgi:hypothetical protein